MADFKIPLIFCLLISFGGSAQVNRYIVKFKDKNGTPYTIDHPENFLSVKSLTRRSKQKLAITENDLPVNPAYVAQLKSLAKTYYTSRWMNCVLTEIDQSNLIAVAALPFVDTVILVAPGNKLLGGRTKKIKNKTSAQTAVATTAQLTQLGIDEMHREGYHGENISIAVLDGGFPGVESLQTFQSLVQNHQIKLTFNFVKNTADVNLTCGGCEHGTEVFSTIAVNTDNFSGGAYGADFYLFVTEDIETEYRIEEYNWLFGAEKADSVGVDVISTSLGYNQFDDASMDYTYANMDGRTTVIARAATFAMEAGMVVVCSAGNEGNNGWHYITSPADAVGIISCGAVNSGGAIAGFSSRGPTADQRIKPDVVAMGSGTAIILKTGAIGSSSGTSFSCPLVASLVAGILQAYPYLTTSQVYDVIISSADRFQQPGNTYGYGVPNFKKVKNYIEASDTVSIYPNPSNNNKVSIDFAYDIGVTTVSFFDSFGRLLSKQAVTVSAESNPIVLDVSALAAGWYYIKVANSLSTKTFRFVKI